MALAPGKHLGPYEILTTIGRLSRRPAVPHEHRYGRSHFAHHRHLELERQTLIIMTFNTGTQLGAYQTQRVSEHVVFAVKSPRLSTGYTPATVEAAVYDRRYSNNKI